MREEWTVPESWAWDVYEAMERFAREAGVTKEALASALGVHKTSLAISHLRPRKRSRYIYQRLPYVLRRERLFSIADALQLDEIGYRALKTLAGQILSLNSGYAINPDMLVEDRDEALALGMLGVEFFDRALWRPATPHLESAWAFFESNPPDTNAPDFQIPLWVGTQLTSRQAYEGQAEEALRIIKTLLQWARAYRGSERATWEAICLLYKDAGVLMRHAGRHPEFVVEKFRIAERLSVEKKFSRLYRISALRDQAKPLLRWGWEQAETPAPNRVAEALTALERAEALAGGERPDDEAREDWLFTRLTRIECLAALRQGAEAKRLWEKVQTEAHPCNEAAAPLAAKVRFTQIAVCVASGDVEGAAKEADAFRANPAHALYGERLRRAAKMERLASEGDLATLRSSLIE